VPPIEALTIRGFKSIRDETTITIRPLTLLAGANSSGKSSIVQPLLLLKQTLDAPYDPGPLLLNGANVRFNQASQLFHRGVGTNKDQFLISATADGETCSMYFDRKAKVGLELSRMDWTVGQSTMSLTPKMTGDDVATLRRELATEARIFAPRLELEAFPKDAYPVFRNRCFLQLPSMRSPSLALPVRSIIHVPGLRGNPARTYPVSAVGATFPGTFENYTASVISAWQDRSESPIRPLSDQLAALGLTWKVTAERIDDTQVELRVGRTPKATRGGAKDLVSVADVGFGVSQTLPVLVALLTAERGQVVYLEQPEIHLHPRAQVTMAKILADAAKRGVRVIAETHSALLLTGVQTLVAQGDLQPDLVKLHWFTRDDEGVTNITSANLDSDGAFGESPVDFGEVELEAESAYLDAVESKLVRGQ
jgi:hypothetical protein